MGSGVIWSTGGASLMVGAISSTSLVRAISQDPILLVEGVALVFLAGHLIRVVREGLAEVGSGSSVGVGAMISEPKRSLRRQ